MYFRKEREFLKASRLIGPEKWYFWHGLEAGDYKYKAIKSHAAGT